MLGRISTAPDHIEPSELPLIPDLSHLPDEWRQKYTELFTTYKDAVSQNNKQLGQCRLPPVHIETTPGVTYASPPKKYSREEEQLLIDHVRELEELGIVEEITHYSPWSHDILLVPKSDTEKLDRTVVGKDRLEQLKKGVRFVSNLKHINKVLPPVNSIRLTNFAEILPLLGGKRVAAFDAKHGYFQLPLDDASKDIFAFSVGSKRFRYKVLPQGCHASSQIFMTCMETVLSEEAWEEFKAEVGAECLSNCVFRMCFVVYLDDTFTIMTTHEQLYYGCQFILRQFEKFNMRLSAKKIMIDHPETTLLGFCVSSKTNTYKLSGKRAEAMLAWNFPSSRAQTQSRLAACQYWSQVIPGLKHIAICLGLLARTKNEFVFEQVHFLEYLMLRLIISLNIELTIPRLQEGQTLYCSSDASFAVMSGVMFQNERDLDQEGNPVGDRVMRVCGVTSRNFTGPDLCRHVIWKECFAMLNTLEVYKYWIAASKRTIFFTDCVSLALLSRLKVQSSKLYTFSVYLSTLKNVYFFHSRGSKFLVSLSDLLSRGLGDSKIEAPVSIPQEILEDVTGVKFKDNFVVTPDCLHRLMTGDLPGHYSQLPYRKRQRPPPDLTDETLEEILAKAPPEKEVLDAIFNGYSSIRPDTVAFVDQTTGKKIGKSQFEEIKRKYNFDQIRELSYMVAAHSYHVTEAGDMKQIIFEYLNCVKDYLTGKSLNAFQSELLQKIIMFLQSERVDISVLRLIVSQVIKIPELSFDSVHSGLVPVQIILCLQSRSSMVTVDLNGDKLVLKVNQSVTLHPFEIKKLNISVLIETGFVVEFVSQWQVVTVTTVINEIGTRSLLTVATLFNHSDQGHTLEAGQVLGQILLHGGTERCCCGINFKKLLVLDRLETELDIFIESENIENQTRFLLYNVMTSVTGHRWDPVVKQAALCDGVPAAIFPCYNTTISDKMSMSKSDYNRLILLSNMLQNGKVLSNHIICQFQRSCQHLISIIDQVERNETDKFVLKSQLLFKRSQVLGQEVHLLCLDRVTFGFLCDNLHSTSNMHHSPAVLTSYLKSMFYCYQMVRVIEESCQKCGVCYFSRPCYRNKLVISYYGDPPPIGFRWSCDMVENFPLDKLKNKYLFVLCEFRTTFTIVFPMKSLKSSELVSKLEPFMPVLGASEIISDFGGVFKHELRDLLARYHVSHTKSCPSTPSANQTEGILKLWRRSFKAFLLGLPADQTQYWSRHVFYFNTIWNCSIIHPDKQPLTRFNLLFNSRRSVNSRFLSVLPGGSESFQMQETAQQIIDDYRIEMKKKYKSGRLPLFRVGMLVSLLSTKSELQVTHPSAGLMSNNQKIFRILSLTKSAARCVELTTGNCQTIGLGKLHPVTSDVLYADLGFDPQLKNSFERNLFSVGPQRSLLQVLRQPESDIMELIDEGEPSLTEISQQYDRHVEHVERDGPLVELGQDGEVGHDVIRPDQVAAVHKDSEHVARDEPVEGLSGPVQGDLGAGDPEQGEHHAGHRYQLRSKVKKVYLIKNKKSVSFRKNCAVKVFLPNQLTTEFQRLYYKPIVNKFVVYREHCNFICNPDFSKAEWCLLAKQ